MQDNRSANTRSGGLGPHLESNKNQKHQDQGGQVRFGVQVHGNRRAFVSATPTIVTHFTEKETISEMAGMTLGDAGHQTIKRKNRRRQIAMRWQQRTRRLSERVSFARSTHTQRQDPRRSKSRKSRTIRRRGERENTVGIVMSNESRFIETEKKGTVTRKR